MGLNVKIKTHFIIFVVKKSFYFGQKVNIASQKYLTLYCNCFLNGKNLKKNFQKIKRVPPFDLFLKTFFFKNKHQNSTFFNKLKYFYI